MKVCGKSFSSILMLSVLLLHITKIIDSDSYSNEKVEQM